MYLKSAEWFTSIISIYLRRTRRILPQRHKMQHMADFIVVFWEVPTKGLSIPVCIPVCMVNSDKQEGSRIAQLVKLL